MKHILEPASRLTRQRQTRLDHLDPPCDSSILLSPKSSSAIPIAKNSRMVFVLLIQLQADFNAHESMIIPLHGMVSDNGEQVPTWGYSIRVSHGKKPVFHKHAIYGETVEIDRMNI